MGKWGSTAGGAASGASVGSMIAPGVGTAIGAGVGGVLGFFSGKEEEEAAKNAQMGPSLLEGRGAQFQEDVQGMAHDVAAGYNDPSMQLAKQQALGQNLISQQMMGQGIGQGMAAQRSLAASARPGQGGLAQRQAAQQSGALAAQATREGQIMAMQEQAQAAQFLAQQRNQINDQMARLKQMELSGLISEEQAIQSRFQLQNAAQQNERATGWYSQVLGAAGAIGQLGAAGAFGGGGGGAASIGKAVGQYGMNQQLGSTLGSTSSPSMASPYTGTKTPGY